MSPLFILLLESTDACNSHIVKPQPRLFHPHRPSSLWHAILQSRTRQDALLVSLFPVFI
ncbi:hypothetical protein IF1G_10317 [Cordyceps javanica]|uniref:Uncharacterized protein n=1 Tax=Cordyceps javanica TaxID=43265 RepID=A0A545UNP1_9HYPO|nr:hypothetical protein IF1G_10317 [Cordyceps javanica]